MTDHIAHARAQARALGEKLAHARKMQDPTYAAAYRATVAAMDAKAATPARAKKGKAMVL